MQNRTKQVKISPRTRNHNIKKKTFDDAICHFTVCLWIKFKFYMPARHMAYADLRCRLLLISLLTIGSIHRSYHHVYKCWIIYQMNVVRNTIFIYVNYNTLFITYYIWSLLLLLLHVQWMELFLGAIWPHESFSNFK